MIYNLYQVIAMKQRLVAGGIKVLKAYLNFFDFKSTIYKPYTIDYIHSLK